MTLHWLAVIALPFAAFRLTRLVGWDEITVDVRTAICGVSDRYYVDLSKFVEDVKGAGRDPWNTPMLSREGEPLMLGSVISPRRYYLAKLLHCPWCVGFWISLGLCAWTFWWDTTTVVLTTLAVSSLVGLIAKNLDP